MKPLKPLITLSFVTSLALTLSTKAQELPPEITQVIKGMDEVLKCYQPDVQPGRLEGSKTIQIYQSAKDSEQMLAVLTLAKYPSLERLKTEKTQIPLLVKKTKFNAREVQQSQDATTLELLRALNLSVYDVATLKIYQLSIHDLEIIVVEVTNNRGVVYTLDMSQFPFFILCA